MEKDNYLKYRGKCKELCEIIVSKDPSLKMVRGYYHDAFWGKQPHWWIVKQDGIIIDPSILQFPDKNGEYEEFSGICHCYQCGKEILEENGQIYGNYIFCSGKCIYNCVM